MERGQGKPFSVIWKTGARRRRGTEANILVHLQSGFSTLPAYLNQGWLRNPLGDFAVFPTAEDCLNPGLRDFQTLRSSGRMGLRGRGMKKNDSNINFSSSQNEIWSRQVHWVLTRCKADKLKVRTHTHMPRPVSLHDVDFCWGFR